MTALIDTYAMPPLGLLDRYDGCCRYISHEPSKTLTAEQVRVIHGHGKTIVLNFEDAATNAKGGQPQGHTDGGFFVGQARGLRAPAGVAGYASVDYEVHGGTALTVAENYFRGWTPVLHAAGYLSGAYGDYDLLAALLRAGLIDLGWQTVAWSYGARERDTRVCLLQDQFQGSYDVDEIEHGFYGGWTPTGPQPRTGVFTVDATSKTEIQKMLDSQRSLIVSEVKAALAPVQVAIEKHDEWLTGLVIHGDPKHPNSQDATASLIRNIEAKEGPS